MTSDLQSLLAAIIADPGDDTARLAYADCLQEHGNEPRAEFIRLQVEAERLHPHSNARAALEAQVRALFEQNWIEWWSEVCLAVGLHPPTPKPAGRLGRLAQWAGARASPGAPYRVSATFLWHQEVGPGVPSVGLNVFSPNERTVKFVEATFRRGFADSLGVERAPLESEGDRNLVAKWARAEPLDALHSPPSALGPVGPHLRGLRALTIPNGSPQIVGGWLRSQHLERLEALFVRQSEGTTADWRNALAGPRARQLKRLGIHIPRPSLAAVVALAPALSALRALSLELGSEPAKSLAVFTGSPRAERIEELTLSGRLTPDVFAALRNSAWPALRKLTISHYTRAEINNTEALLPFNLPFPSLAALVASTNLPALEELTFRSLRLDRSALDALVGSSLLKQLKHFCCHGWLDPTSTESTASLLEQVVDTNRIETFALGLLRIPERAAHALKVKFGDRVQFL